MIKWLTADVAKPAGDSRISCLVLVVVLERIPHAEVVFQMEIGNYIFIGRSA